MCDRPKIKRGNERFFTMLRMLLTMNIIIFR